MIKFSNIIINKVTYLNNNLIIQQFPILQNLKFIANEINDTKILIFFKKSIFKKRFKILFFFSSFFYFNHHLYFLLITII